MRKKVDTNVGILSGEIINPEKPTKWKTIAFYNKKTGDFYPPQFEENDKFDINEFMQFMPRDWSKLTAKEFKDLEEEFKRKIKENGN